MLTYTPIYIGGQSRTASNILWNNSELDGAGCLGTDSRGRSVGVKRPPGACDQVSGFPFLFPNANHYFPRAFSLFRSLFKIAVLAENWLYVTVQGSDYSGCDVVGGFWSQC